MRKVAFGRMAFSLVIVLLLVGAGTRVIPSAQTQDAGSAQALRELVTEVRALRGVIERYTDGQAQTQTISDLLSVQQRRVADVTARLDATRKELDAVVLESRRQATEIENMERGVRPEESFGATAVEQRRNFQITLAALKEDLERKSTQEQLIRNRESDLLQQLAGEEGRWTELVGRLEQWLRK